MGDKEASKRASHPLKAFLLKLRKSRILLIPLGFLLMVVLSCDKRSCHLLHNILKLKQL